MTIIYASTHWPLIVAFIFYGEQLKLEYISCSVIFYPSINEMKVAIVGPNPLTQLLICLDDIWPLYARFIGTSSGCEFTIFGLSTRGKKFWLVYNLRHWGIGGFWLVMTFVDKNGAILINPILVWSVGASRH